MRCWGCVWRWKPGHQYDDATGIIDDKVFSIEANGNFTRKRKILKSFGSYERIEALFTFVDYVQQYVQIGKRYFIYLVYSREYFKTIG